MDFELGVTGVTGLRCEKVLGAIVCGVCACVCELM